MRFKFFVLLLLFLILLLEGNREIREMSDVGDYVGKVRYDNCTLGVKAAGYVLDINGVKVKVDGYGDFLDVTDIKEVICREGLVTIKKVYSEWELKDSDGKLSLYLRDSWR